MVNTTGSYSEVVLFYPTQSLVLQVADWVRKNPQLTLRLVSSESGVDVGSELHSASIVIVDATQAPGRAMDLLDKALLHLGRPNAAVYTEQAHRGLKSWWRCAVSR